MDNDFHNPYAAPVANVEERFEEHFVVHEGTFGGGFALGFILGLWGWLGCLLLAKAETKRGATYGFLSRVGLGVIVAFIALLAG